MQYDFHEKIREYFSVLKTTDSLSLTLVNPNIDLDAIKSIKQQFGLMTQLKKYQVVIIQNPNFDDQLLKSLCISIPESVTELTLDFSGCQSLRGEGFLDLFEKVSGLTLTKLHLDLGQIIDINDIVMQGLGMLLGDQPTLQQLYLDLYEVDCISQQGYMSFAESISSLTALKSLHLDFSSNPHISEDNLELLFSNLSANLQTFHFKISDIDSLGGGSFYKLAQSFILMDQLTQLHLTISCMANIDSKTIIAVLQSISNLQKLVNLKLELSDLNLPEKILSNIALPSLLAILNLDISCNKSITDNSIINLTSKLDQIIQFQFNFDFTKVTQFSISELINVIMKNGKCQKLVLTDRKYSQSLVKQAIDISTQNRNLILLKMGIEQAAQNIWQKYKQYQIKKNSIIYAIYLLKLRKYPKQLLRNIVEIMI